jgi:hypothetical protein
MNKSFFITILFISIITFLSCSKSNGSSSSSGDKVTYEVISTGGTWSGDYFDDSNGSMSLKFVSNQPSGWKYSFTVPKGKHVGLVLSAIPDIGGTLTATIYVNNQVVASDQGITASAQSTLN